MDERKTILIVDDTPDNLLFLSSVLKDDFRVKIANDGTKALKAVATGTPPDLILLDIMMPELDGYEVCRRLKEDQTTRSIPIVFVTSKSSHEDILKGLRLGAYYYLTKPIESTTLFAVIHAALEESESLLDLQKQIEVAEYALLQMKSCEFGFRDLMEVNRISVFLAQACPEPSRAVLGLKELMTNAVEHGNLAICYEEKSRLLHEGGFSHEIERRLNSLEYSAREATVQFRREQNQIAIIITDQGEGFEWQRYLDFDPDRVYDPNGRGIAMANMSGFDELKYMGKGNEVLGIFHLK
ncbi:MAG: response regulator [Magnetococcales bacterium]|nr:response regulator [Magnetococcales bacterium]